MGKPPLTTRPHPASLPPDRLLEECDVRFMRRSGPGGQNKNKVETAVILTHRPSGLTAEANEKRYQGENKEVANFRLRVNLALQVREAAGPDRGPSLLWRSRVKGGKIAVNPSHRDFPALLAEALDFLDGRKWDVKAVAEELGCSASQLTKFLKLDPRALKLFNDRRAERGLRPLL